jgi:nuclease S1
MRCFKARLILFAFFLPALPALAWGPAGHAIVADIAVDHLTPAARRTLEQLLGNTDLAKLSSWPDQIRPVLPETGPWHYVDIPSTADGYVASRDCIEDNCAVAKILWFSQMLKNPKLSPSAHIVALQYLVHLVGDLHQPFHALADARGGNDIPVTVFGQRQCGSYPCELHEVWDSELIQHTGMDAKQYTAYLEKTILDEHLEAGPDDPVLWANASWTLAKEALVQPCANIDEAYYTRERPVVDQQLALAGLRLAQLLNEDLSDGWAMPALAASPKNNTGSTACPATNPNVAPSPAPTPKPN